METRLQVFLQHSFVLNAGLSNNFILGMLYLKSTNKFCFQFEFFFNFDFQMHKAHLKSFVFEILFIGDYRLTFYLVDGKV